MNARKRPCENCPWRTDATPGEFPLERYEALRDSVPDGSEHPGLLDPMFACHKSAEGKEIACAGWLVRYGVDHLRSRLALALGEIEMPQPDETWPELYPTYDALVDAQ